MATDLFMTLNTTSEHTERIDEAGSRSLVSRAEAERLHPEVYVYGDPEDTDDNVAGPS